MPAENTAITIEEPARQIPVIETVDVLVAGSGPAGIAAALAAAREGARTTLVERYGYLGGMITGAYVVAIIGCGDGRAPVVRGVTEEIRRRLEKLDAVKPINKSGDYRVDAETFKWQAVEMLTEAGVNIRLHTLACAPIIEADRVAGIFVESKSGRQAIRATVTVDATADADLTYRAGCACDDEPHEVTLGIRIAGVDRERVDAFAKESPERYQAVIDEAMRRNGGVMPGRGRLLKGINVADTEDLTRAEILFRKECFDALMYLKENLPGYEAARVTETFPQIGVRQGRRIRGEYILQNDDLKSSRKFENGIGRMGVYFPEWGPNYAIEGLDYDVPYGCLVPEKTDGLLVGGRCVSSDYTACNTMRLIVPCFVTGQAAGCAAAIAVQDACAPRHISVGKLRRSLLNQDVHLG